MNEHGGMPVPGPDLERRDVAYDLQGDFLEVCDCFTICACWTGGAPDEGECTGVFAWVIGQGSIDGVGVAGRTVVSVSTHEGHRDQAHQRVQIFVDEAASDAEVAVLAPTFAGLRGGPLGDLGRILGVLDAVERKSIQVAIDGARAKLTVGRSIEASTRLLVGPNGQIMTLANAKLSTVLGNPAEVGVASRFRVGMPGSGIDLDLRGRSAMRGAFAYRHEPTKQ